MSAPDHLVGTTIAGRYRIESRLGAGAMGVVYRAMRIDARRPVAIKFLQDSSPAFVKRFEREVSAASRLSHPHLAEILDSGVTDGSPFLVMEFVAGQPLTQLVRSGPIEPKRAVGLVRQILAGIHHAHTGGIVHRDLKPDNVILLDRSDGDFIKVLDFGMAKIVRGEGDGELLTLDGTTMGTPSYIAPEQARAEPIDRRADLYSVGVVLYEFVVGRKPFVGDAPIEILRQHLSAAPIPPRAAMRPPSRCSPELERVILRALEKSPDRRWQTAKEFDDALEHTPEGRDAPGIPLVTAPEIQRAMDTVQSDFAAYVRDAIEAAVEIALAGQRIAEAREGADAYRQAAAVDLGRIDKLETAVRRTVAATATGAADSAAARCADGIERSVRDVSARQRDEVREQLAADLARIEADIAQTRMTCVRAFDALVRHHDLPGAFTTFYLRAKGDEQYTALHRCRTRDGITATVALDVPASHPFAKVLRLEQSVEGIEFDARGLTRWLRQAFELGRQRYDLTEFATQRGHALLRMRRRADNSSGGFDITIEPDPPRVRVLPIDDSGTPMGTPVEPDEPARSQLRALGATLVSLASDVSPHRRALVDLRVDGEPFDRIDAFAFTCRLVASIVAPLREFAIDSRKKDDLVLARERADGRREQFVVSKSQLRARLARVPRALRALFAPLGIDPAVPPPLPRGAKRRVAAATESAPADVPTVDSADVFVEASDEEIVLSLNALDVVAPATPPPIPAAAKKDATYRGEADKRRGGSAPRVPRPKRRTSR